MCEVCGKVLGHLPGCPEGPEEETIRCDFCGTEIVTGEDYYTGIDEYGDIVCQDCFEEWAYKHRRENF